MCVVCGCGEAVAAVPAEAGGLQASGPGPQVNPTTGDLHFGTGTARVSVPGLSPARTLQLEADVLGVNDRIAQVNRAHFRDHGVVALNLLSSPGSGKTSLLVATLQALRRQQPALALGVIEGDQQTSHDAERIRATGVPAIQVNTGKGCHLDAPMVAAAFARLPMHGLGHGHGQEHEHEHEHWHRHRQAHEPAHARDRGLGHAPAPPALLFIENVGNLVCPALWDLGEAAKVVLLSVTEGEDKPLKYPDMFAAARLLVLTKTDLLPHVDFDVQRCIANARQVNPGIEVLQLSARSGEGLQAWLRWLGAWPAAH
jgi:hydrogenase nickel incorporation protein HypB